MDSAARYTLRRNIAMDKGLTLRTTRHGRGAAGREADVFHIDHRDKSRDFQCIKTQTKHDMEHLVISILLAVLRRSVYRDPSPQFKPRKQVYEETSPG